MEKRVKRVKKTTRHKNFYFSIYNHIKEGSYPSKIAKDLNISKQRVNYYIASLKERNLIQFLHQGVWKTTRDYDEKRVKKTTRIGTNQLGKSFYSFDSDIIRGHAFLFRLRLPKDLKNWDNQGRIKALKKLNMSYKELTHLFGGGQRIIFRGRKIYLTNKSIIIFEKASYFAETSYKSHALAIIKILYIIKALEQKLRTGYMGFAVKGNYEIKTTRQHYALIKNALAKIYDKEGNKLEVYDHKGLWLLIDNSFNLHELECVSSETSKEDSEKVKSFFNAVKKGEFEDIKSDLQETKEILNDVSKKSIMTGQVLDQMSINIIKITGELFKRKK